MCARMKETKKIGQNVRFFVGFGETVPELKVKNLYGIIYLTCMHAVFEHAWTKLSG